MLNHKQKVKLARRIRTSEEEHDRVSIFDTVCWNTHRKAIIKKVVSRNKQRKKK